MSISRKYTFASGASSKESVCAFREQFFFAASRALACQFVSFAADEVSYARSHLVLSNIIIKQFLIEFDWRQLARHNQHLRSDHLPAAFALYVCIGRVKAGLYFRAILCQMSVSVIRSRPPRLRQVLPLLSRTCSNSLARISVSEI